MTIVYNILKLKERRVNLRTTQTPQEVLLWSRLRREQLGFKFRRQHSIGGYIVDFYCPLKKLVIEIDGSQHFGNKEYHEIRSKYLEGLDIKVIRFTNAEINTNMSGVIDKIMNELNQKWHEKESKIVKDQILLRGYSDEYEKEYIKKDGTSFPISIRVWAIKDENGNNTGMWGIVRDITERKALDKLKDEFVSTVSHELRTPMTSIREAVSLMLDGIMGETNEMQKKYLTMCLKNIDWLKRIINNLLDIGKIEAGKYELKKERIAVHGIIDHALTTFRAYAKNIGLTLKSNMPEKEIFIYADIDKVLQVLSNLIGNSMKFTKEGSIEISVVEKDSEVEFSVKDTGMGISEKDLPKVFGRFQQFGRVEGHGEKGTGLGLSISKGIVELHGGTINLESAPGFGTRFYFTIPRFNAEKALHDKIAVQRKENESFTLFMVKLSNDLVRHENVFVKVLQALKDCIGS